MLELLLKDAESTILNIYNALKTMRQEWKGAGKNHVGTK